MNNENFNDPLEGFDPVMEDAFSVNEENKTEDNTPIVEEAVIADTEPAPTTPASNTSEEAAPTENYFDSEEPISHTTKAE